MSQSAKKSSHELYLGVDGGGTKTSIVIMDAKEVVLADALAGPSNPLRVGVDTAVANILGAVNEACEKVQRSPDDIVSATVGLAGARRADTRESVQKRLHLSLWAHCIEVFSDAKIALYGTTLGKSGVVVIAGTGSICYGEDAKGKSATAGGWGPIAGDEGGGSGIAKQALHAIAKAFDGRGRETKLSEVGAEYFRASSAEDLIVAIYSPFMDNKRLSGFAKCVVETAVEGDEIAIEILSVAGFELGLAAYAVIKKLEMKKRKVPIGTVGSIFNAGELITIPLIDTVHSFAPKAFLKEPELEPAHAAAVMAMRGEKFR